MRGTCAIARLIMCNWDREWMRTMEENIITINGYWRYMDDGRILLPAFKAGWRWKENELKFSQKWVQEDENKTGLQRTMEIVEASLQGVHSFLKFTIEVGEGAGEWLPTLDMMMRVEENNMVSFKYYEKPTTSNTMVQKRTALGENSKNQILANDLMRRLGNTDERQGVQVRGEVVDGFAKKVLTSGYSIQQTRRIIINGIRGWERRKRTAIEERTKVFRTGKESRPNRIEKRTIGTRREQKQILRREQRKQ